MKLGKFFPLIMSIIITSCSNGADFIFDHREYFSTSVEVRLYQGSQDNINDIFSICDKLDRLTDNYHKRDITNIYSLNNSNEEFTVDE